MNAQAFARAAYGRPEGSHRNPRQVEYDLFARITRRLQDACVLRGKDFPGLVSALHENLRLWRLLATDVSHPENGLPQQLRARLFYLYEFTDQHSRKVMSGNAAPEVLVEINTAIMRGLRGDGDRP